MEAALNQVEVNCLERLFSVCVAGEETFESVVPDVLPDIGEIVDTDGLVFLRSKTAEQGEMRLTGTVSAVVLYMPENSASLCRLRVEIPYTFSYEAAELDCQCSLQGSVRLRGIDARALNPRKVLVRADLEAVFRAYRETSHSLCSGLQQSGQTTVHTLERQLVFTPVTSVGEKAFVLSDAYQLPASKPPIGELLKQRLELAVDEVKAVGNKLVFKGLCKTELLYAGPEGELSEAAWTTGFSQLMEMDALGEGGTLQVELMPTGASWQLSDSVQDNRVLTAEVHVVAQATGWDRREIRYIADAYSSRYPVEIRKKEMELIAEERALTLRETVRTLIETPRPVREIAHVYTEAGTCIYEKDSIRCALTIHCLYWDEDNCLSSARKRLTAETAVALDTDMFLDDLRIHCTDAYASPGAGGIELRMPVDFRAEVCRSCVAEPVEGLTLLEDTPFDLNETPTFTVLREPGRDLWTLAKGYRAVPEQILEANGITELEELQGVLLIPGCR